MRYVRLSCILAIAALAVCSCKNSPATTVMGNYEGAYFRDTLSVGDATCGVVDVNPLTVNIIVDLANDPDFNLNSVEVDQDSAWFNLLYNGTEGAMSGTITGSHMEWTLMSSTDTITFLGNKLQ